MSTTSAITKKLYQKMHFQSFVYGYIHILTYRFTLPLLYVGINLHTHVRDSERDRQTEREKDREILGVHTSAP